MKRALVVLVIFAVLSGGTVNALSILPHTHGQDTNHSRHASCPVYQVGMHGFQAPVEAAPIDFALSISNFLDAFAFQSLFQPVYSFHFLRAPPVS